MGSTDNETGRARAGNGSGPPRRLVLVFAEADYRYGLGSLQLRVETIDRSRPLSLDGDIWYLVTGVEIGRDGRERNHREVAVRARRLPT